MQLLTKIKTNGGYIFLIFPPLCLQVVQRAEFTRKECIQNSLTLIAVKFTCEFLLQALFWKLAHAQVVSL